MLRCLANRQRVIGQVQPEDTVKICAFEARFEGHATRGENELVIGQFGLFPGSDVDHADHLANAVNLLRQGLIEHADVLDILEERPVADHPDGRGHQLVKVADLTLNVVRHAATGVRQQPPTLHDGDFRVWVTAPGPGCRFGAGGDTPDDEYAIRFHVLCDLSWQSLD